MTECLQLKHTFEGREAALNHCSSLKELGQGNKYTYKLWHTYDIEPTPVFVNTGIDPVTFEVLLAHILFEASKIDDCYAVGQEEIIPLLSKLYKVETIESDKCVEDFDLYYTWEKWCALYDEVLNLEVFKRDTLREELSKFIPEED